MASSEHTANRIKTGASLLANGGTLTSDPCPKCSGVQVRFGDKITCINCSNETITTTAASVKPKADQDKVVPPARRSAVLASAISVIEEKIESLVSEIRVENDISMQRQKADVLDRYLGILEKAKNLLG
jgi:uncharacterized Zn finger protein (UPF0148 family)